MGGWTSSRFARPGMVVLGDSVAQGRDDPDPAGGWIGWPRRLARNLGLERVANVAADGATAASVAGEQLAAVRDLRPDVVALNCGMNDALNGFASDEMTEAIARIHAWARAAGALLVTVAVPAPPVLERGLVSEFRRRKTLARIAEINQELTRSAARAGSVHAELEHVPEVHEPDFWSSDGVHLSSTGHERVAEVTAAIALAAIDAPRLSPSG